MPINEQIAIAVTVVISSSSRDVFLWRKQSISVSFQ